MKQPYIMLAVLCLILFSCKKNNTTTSDFEFIVNGVNDVSMYTTGTGLLGLSTEYISGTQEVVTYSISGLPVGVTDSFSTKSGTPTFASFLTFKSKNAATGTSKITLSAKTASGKSKDYTFNLTLAANPDCRDELVGTYDYSSACTGGFPGSVTVTKDPANSDRILINQFPYNLSTTVTYAIVNCTTGTLTIPNQNVNYPGTVYGSGTYSPGTMDITYYMTPGPGGSCTGHFTK